MGQTEATRQSDFILPPTYGGITVLATSTSAVSVDLTTMSGSPYQAGANQGQGEQGQGNANTDPFGHYITLQATGADCYVMFADTQPHAAAINATNTSTVTSNALVTPNTATGAICIPAGTMMSFKLLPGAYSTGAPSPTGQASLGRWLGFLTASGTGYLRIWQSSP